jgi:hypothetical protein
MRHNLTHLFASNGDCRSSEIRSVSLLYDGHFTDKVISDRQTIWSQRVSKRSDLAVNFIAFFDAGRMRERLDLAAKRVQPLFYSQKSQCFI